jgi:DNA-binding NtrC family response regulator/tetratricopeptide (TPR) repeat protein
VSDAIGVARASVALARIERWSRAYFRAERLVRDAIAATREGGARREAALAIEEAGALAFARGDIRGAAARFHEALGIVRGISSVNDQVTDLERRLAEIALVQGDTDGAFDSARRAYGAGVRVMDKRMAAEALRVLACTFRRRGEKNRARSAFTRSIRSLERIGAPLELAKALRDAGRLDGEAWCTPHESRDFLTRSESLFRNLGLVHEAGKVLLERARLETTLRNYLDAMNLLREAEWASTEAADSATLEDVLALRRRLEEDMARETAHIDTEFLSLNKVFRAREADLDAVFRRIIDSTRAHRGFVVVDDNGRSTVKACEGMPAIAARALHRELAARHAERLAAREAVISYGDFARGESDVLSYILVPFSIGEHGSGALYVDRLVGLDVSPFGRLELHFLGGVGAQVGTLLESEAAGIDPAGNGTGSPFSDVVTRSARLMEILDILNRVAASSSTILLQGETGTGKGLLAHEVSRERSGPFVTINCADLSETVLESELFGHARNAFTGAGDPKKGLFEIADGGTVFIDEIDKTSRNFQERLLRVVDRREIKPVGTTKVKRVDCRIIVAANRDLRGLVESGGFLKDLYYRLRVIAIEIPPLRERREDIPVLVEHFLAKFQAETGKSGIRFSARAIECMRSHDWPGNVRDLEHEIERAVALANSGDEIEPENLSTEVFRNPVSEAVAERFKGKTLSRIVEEIEERMVREALVLHKGNKSRAAAELGLTRRGLKNKIERYRIS